MNLKQAQEHYQNNPLVKCILTGRNKVVNSSTIRYRGKEFIISSNYQNRDVFLVNVNENKQAKIIDV